MTQTFPMLYKRTSTGAVQYWQVETEGGKYRTRTGKVGGKEIITAWTVVTPKNVGKANEIDVESQAVLEAQAKYAKKSREDFHTTVDNVDTKTRVNPMLAKKWEDEENSIPDEEVIYFQPKLDGFRCVINKDGAWARSGLPLLTIPHILIELAPLFAADPTLEFDGELFTQSVDFNTISSIARKKNPVQTDLVRALQLEYWIYDITSSKKNFKNRSEELAKMFCLYRLNYIILVPTYTGTKADAMSMLLKFLKEKFEGGMARRDGPYEPKRSKYLLKIKEFQDAEFTIKDIVSGKGNAAGIAKSVLLENAEGLTFSAGTLGTDDQNREMLENKAEYIGQPGTVVFFELTPRGVPRFGKFKGLRWDK